MVFIYINITWNFNADRMKKYLILLVTIVCCSCARKDNNNIERISNMPYVVLTDSIYTRMPGRLFYTDKYVVWVDPFESKGFVHVLDACSGRELGRLGNVGDGPNEFTSTMLSLTHDSLLVLVDMNKDLQGYIDLSKVGDDSSAAFVKWTFEKSGKFTRYLEIGEGQSLKLYPGVTKPLVYNQDGVIDSVGRFPIEEKIRNGYNIYQGEVCYNADKKCLIYSTFALPYVSMYHFNGNKFILDWEKREDADYRIVKGKLKITNPSASFHEMTLTKDYIVVAKRDTEIDGELPKDLKKKDPMKAIPYSLFIYDYDYRLKKIIRLDAPVMRIAGNVSCNTLCAIVVDPEFTIIKLELPC